MNLFAFRKRREIKPPFKNTIKDVVDWVKPVTVFLDGNYGGMLISPDIVAVTHMLDEKSVDVIVNGRRVEGINTRIELDNYWLTFYKIPEQSWQGLPCRTEPLGVGTYLFSYIKGKIIGYEPVAVDSSEAVASYQESDKLKINYDLEYTFPVVDMFGYFVCLGLGSCENEGIGQTFQLKNTKW